MGRWRPPPEKSSPYITPQGESALKKELKELWQLRRKDVVPALTAAAAEGDRSENAEYIYRKKQLGEIDRRIRYLSKRLDEVQVVDRIPAKQDRVFSAPWSRSKTRRAMFPGTGSSAPMRSIPGWVIFRWILRWRGHSLASVLTTR